MTHPGLPAIWGMVIAIGIVAISLWVLLAPRISPYGLPGLFRIKNPVPKGLFSWITRPLSKLTSFISHQPLILAALRIVFVALFVLIIITGLMGTLVPSRNLATVLTWNVWWTGLVVLIFFLGSAWCAVCPWNTLANWLVHRKLWRRPNGETSFSLRVPKQLRNLMPALVLLIVLTWLELGIAVTNSPFDTAMIAIAMLILAALSLVIFERRAFCRFACPVGRTVGFYAQLAPVELRPVSQEICQACTTLECYYGTEQVEPCPTHLVMGRMTQNTYCLSCCNCVQACPEDNVAFRSRPPSREAIIDARPHWDESLFMVTLLSLTLFHGLIMMPFWEGWMLGLAGLFGEQGNMLGSFTILLAMTLIVPLLVYSGTIYLTHLLAAPDLAYQKLFSAFAFVTLPLAFAYHIAHNLNHLLRENSDLASVLSNPFGAGIRPSFIIDKGSMCVATGPLQAPAMIIPPWLLHSLQSALMLAGFLIAVMVIRQRSASLLGAKDNHSPTKTTAIMVAPLLAFAVLMTGLASWLLSQPMLMRMG